MILLIVMITFICVALDQIRILLFRSLPFERLEQKFTSVINKI